MNKIQIIFLTCIVTVFFSQLQAQQIGRQLISPIGKISQTNAIGLTLSAGETIIQSKNSTTLFLSQGFQQGFTNEMVSVYQAFLSENGIKAYPNPFSDQICLQFDITESEELEVKLFNLAGRCLLNEKLNEGTITKNMNFNEFPQGTYFLTIKDKNMAIPKSIKLIKL